MGHGYRIADEPRPGGMAHLVVSPVWPFFGVMLASSVLGWGWFAFNSIAVGCPYRRKTLLWILAGFAGAIALLVTGAYLIASDVLPRAALPYIGILLTAWKLGVSYKIFVCQNQTFEIYRYYGGIVRSGLIVVVILYYFSPRLLEEVPNILKLILR